jgi:hypothetical protein
MPSYGDTYCAVCDLPMATCTMPIPGMGTAPDHGAEWLDETVALFQSGHYRRISHHPSRVGDLWVFDSATDKSPDTQDADKEDTLSTFDSSPHT